MIVAKSQDDLQREKNLLWDSGKVRADSTFHIIYEESKLEKNTTYYWKVKSFLKNNETDWSEQALFRTGYFGKEHWSARWIGSPDTTNRTPYLRDEFTISKPVEDAYVSVTGVGYYEYYLNGEKVGTRELDPAPSQYQERIYYATFDGSVRA